MTNKIDLAQFSVDCPYCDADLECEENKNLNIFQVKCNNCHRVFDVVFECSIKTLAYGDEQAIRETEESLIAEEINAVAKRYT